MIAYVYVLALFFFTITNGQVTSWTGTGGNSSVTNPNNWSNGLPTATSIVYINDTTCNGCTVSFDMAMTIGELHLGASAGTGPSVEIVGVHVTIATAFTLGSPNPTTYWSASVSIQAGGIFELGTACAATIYYTGGTPIGSSYQEENWFINRGTITVLGNGGITAGSYSSIDIGDGSSYPLHVESYGTWDASTGQVEVRFYYLASFNIYGGSFKGSWLTTTSTSYPSIQFYGTDIVLQDGAGGDAAGVGAVTFKGAIYFDSVISQSYNDYSSTPPNSVTFNTTGVTISNALFSGTNIVFLYDGWLMDCNVTDYSLVNSSSTVSGVHAYFVGTDNMVDNSVFAGVGTDFVIKVEYPTRVTMPSYFALTGSVTLINNGTWIYNSGSYLYFDVQATWVNLGLMSVTTSSSDFIYGTQFPGQSSYTDAGTMVNMGTIQFISSGGLNFQQKTGDFRQCKHGILKFGFGLPDAAATPGSVTLPNVKLDGYIGIAFGDNYDPKTKSGYQIFSFITSGNLPSGSFTGLFDTITKGPAAIDTSQIVCFDSATGYVNIYGLLDKGVCPKDTYQTLLPIVTGDACSDLPDKITSLADTASCPAGANCGVNTGAPAGEPNPNSAHSLAVHLAFLVSLVCLLLKF